MPFVTVHQADYESLESISVDGESEVSYELVEVPVEDEADSGRGSITHTASVQKARKRSAQTAGLISKAPMSNKSDPTMPGKAPRVPDHQLSEAQLDRRNRRRAANRAAAERQRDRRQAKVSDRHL